MKRLLAALVFAAAGAGAAQPAFDPAVSALLRAIETSGCRMERNGQLHDGKDAADHLRMKLERSGRPGMGADLFIDRIASGSTVSGSPYRVHCPGQAPVDSRVWLRARLADPGPAPR